MKARVTQLNFRKDPTFDPTGDLVDDEHAMLYIIEVKRHWWNSWNFVIDITTNCPKLFYGSKSVIQFCILNKCKMI